MTGWRGNVASSSLSNTLKRISDELQVTTHGEHAGAPPTLLFEFVEVVGLEIVAVDTNQANKREEDRLVTKAQLGCGLVELDTTVRIGDHLTQQITLAVRLTTAIELAGAMLDIPEGIVDLPHQIEIISVEESYQMGVLIIVGVWKRLIFMR